MANMIPISTVTVGSGGSATIDFINIPQTYTDLIIKTSLRDNNGSVWGGCYVRFNGSQSSYNGIQLYGNGSSVSAATGSGSWGTNYALAGRGTGANATANTFGNSEIYITNYSSNNNKSLSAEDVTESNGTSALMEIISGIWSNSSPITSIQLLTPSATFQQYSTVTLYGIRKY